MASDNVAITSTAMCRCSAVLALLVLTLCGCSSQESLLEKSFSPELVSKARSDFKIDMTDWDISVGQAIPKRVRLVLGSEPGVRRAIHSFCEAKLIKSLNARGFELDPNEQAELMVCIVQASDIRKPVRSAKVRIAARLGTSEGADPILLGIADGIVPRPDLSGGVSMTKSSYFRAAQYAISKLMHQLSSISKTPSSQR